MIDWVKRFAFELSQKNAPRLRVFCETGVWEKC